MFFVLLLSIGFSASIAQGQELKNSEISQNSISSNIKQEIVRRILLFNFKPSKRQKIIYLAKGEIDSSWLPKIPNIEFRLLSDEEIEDRETGVYFFTEPEIMKKSYGINFGFGDMECDYTGGGWNFRVTKNRLMLWYVGEIGGGCGGGRDFKIAGKLNTYLNELQGYKFFDKDKLKGLKVTVSTKEDVKRSFGSDCESGCDYNNDWSVNFSYFGTMTKETTINDKKTKYVPKEEYVGKVYSIRLIPKKHISFSQVAFSNKFNQGYGFAVGDNFNSEGFKGAVGTSYHNYEDRYGLKYTVFEKTSYVVGEAKKSEYSKGNLTEIEYLIPNQIEETLFVEQK